MIKKFTVFCFFVYLWTFHVGCGVAKNDQSLFKIKEAYYQSWIKSENEKGTNVFIELVNVKAGVEFDSIVFRGNKIQAFASIKGNIVLLEGILTVGITRISIDSQPFNSSDQLLYTYKGNKFSIPVKTFNRKESKHLN